MSQSRVKGLTTSWTQSNTKPLPWAMSLPRGPNTFSSSPKGLHGFSGIVRVLLIVLLLLVLDNCVVLAELFYVLFVCKCVLYY